MEDKNNQLNKENIALKYSLQGKITSFGEIIKPGFNFGTVTKSGTPKEYFAAAVLNKLYSLNISTENVFPGSTLMRVSANARLSPSVISIRIIDIDS